MDREESIEKPQRTRLLVFVLVLVIGAAIFVWRFGNPVTWILSYWYPSEIVIETKPRGEQFPKILDMDTWKNLTLFGRVPIEAGEMGRANPFLFVTAEREVGKTPAERDTVRLTDMEALASALEKYKRTTGSYPTGANVQIGGIDAACLSEAGWQPLARCSATGGTIFLPTASPVDPGGSLYRYDLVGDVYSVSFSLEESQGLYASGQHVMTPSGIE